MSHRYAATKTMSDATTTTNCTHKNHTLLLPMQLERDDRLAAAVDEQLTNTRCIGQRFVCGCNYCAAIASVVLAVLCSAITMLGKNMF
jgi:hypothetical protein